MNHTQIEQNLKNLVSNYQSGEVSLNDFIYDLLLAYGHLKQSVTRLKSGDRNLSKEANTIVWKKHLYFKHVDGNGLRATVDAMKDDKLVQRHKIRFVIAMNGTALVALDTKTKDTLDIAIANLAQSFDFFLPWAGMEKAVFRGENPADVKAAEKMAKLFDTIKADNFASGDISKEQLHKLNVFMGRLLFCYFAEDTEIFNDNQFSHGIASHTQEDGSDVADYLKRLFTVLNTDYTERKDLPNFLSEFPYVNGGLFADKIYSPSFSTNSRKLLVECGSQLDWSDINPDIFGSMFQSVIHPDQRSNMGQHYTSVPNIMKVIEPLFLNDLKEAFEAADESITKLYALQQRIGNLKIFDPACGSGNFLIIAYKELRMLEMEILKRIQELELEKTGQHTAPMSAIKLSQFYGIEIDDFAHEVAILSLWLAEHQMNVAFKDEFGEAPPSLPLKNSGNIICANATRIDWHDVCPADMLDEVFVLGNPPYLGARLQSDQQKADMRTALAGLNGLNSLDYISCWFLKGARFIENIKAAMAFVTTNSICQGEQVAMLWPHVLRNGTEIIFAHQSFKWRNNARNNAGVTVAIIGISNKISREKIIYNDMVGFTVKNINAYLVDGNNIFVHKRSNPLSFFPNMAFGSMASDGGHLILSSDEKNDLISNYPKASELIKPLVGSVEFIRGQSRFCLWITENNLAIASSIEPIARRIEQVKNHRLASDRGATRQLAVSPHAFGEVRHLEGGAIIVPRVSSEARNYIPIGFLDDNNIISDSALAVYGAAPWLLSILSSRIHMTWVEAVGGRLKTDFRYSASVIYNTFPFPNIDEAKQNALNMSAINILSVRERYPHKTMAQLYDPELMPDDLKQAHEENDRLVESCYRAKPFTSDEERLEHLFNLYEQMIAEEAARV